MAFYDSVKEGIREEHGEAEPEDGEDNDTMPFDTLKENAEEEPEESEQSGGDIEVLGDGDIADDASEESPESGQEGTGADSPEQRGGGAQRDSSLVDDTAVGDGATEVLERIEEQNREMLDLLRAIKRQLE